MSDDRNKRWFMRPGDQEALKEGGGIRTRRFDLQKQTMDRRERKRETIR